MLGYLSTDMICSEMLGEDCELRGIDNIEEHPYIQAQFPTKWMPLCLSFSKYFWNAQENCLRFQCFLCGILFPFQFSLVRLNEQTNMLILLLVTTEKCSLVSN